MLVVRQRRAASDEVAQVQLGQLVVREIERRKAGLFEGLDERARLARAGQLNADKDARRGAVGDTVVELVHVARADQLAETLEAAAALGDGHGEDRLAPLADL